MALPLNPFIDIFETKKYPHARTLRTSFSQKLSDSFWVLTGGVEKIGDKKHTSIGIFDYLTLGITVLLMYPTDSKIYFISMFFKAISILLLIPRLAFAIVVTAAFSPFIAILQGITHLLSKQLRQDAMSLKGEQTIGGLSSTQTSLLQFLNAPKVSTDDPASSNQQSSEAQIAHTKNSLQKNADKNELEDVTISTQLDAQPGRYLLNFSHPSLGGRQFTVSLDLEEKQGTPVKKRRALHGLFALNIGNIADKIEQDKNLTDQQKNFVLGA